MSHAVNVYPLRLVLYISLGLFSVTLLGLCAARLYYTTHLPSYDPLNGGVSFYDKIAAELVATAILTAFWSLSMTMIISSRSEGGMVSRFRGELIGLFILWLLYLVGAAYSSTIWGNLRFCWDYRTCKILTALVAFAWIGWVTLTLLALTSILFVWANNSFNDPLHGRYYYDGEGRRVTRSAGAPEMRAV